MITQVLNHDLLFSVPSCLLFDDLIKETTCNVMVDHLQSRVTPWRQYARHVKVRGISSKMDVHIPMNEKYVKIAIEPPSLGEHKVWTNAPELPGMVMFGID